ncbi:uracil-DNA glycosylase [Stieleria tagensis]|uniref:uracil-DNA glycosylase n=1 Tax=Stieleria tagensis TaxID=2956795 RepID=UPI00209B3AFE|nr:uracil-DNA glycosylase [Stieleria tagensis]
MPNEDYPNESLQPASILHQVGGLAEHLQRLGVQWLPVPAAENSDRLAAEFQFSGSETDPGTVADPAVTAVDSTVSTPMADAPPVTAPAENPAPAETAAPRPIQRAAAPSGSAGAYPGASLSAAERTEQLAAWAAQAAVCTRCEILAKCRTQTVFGEGSVMPKVVFFGEAPGRDEDLSGRPFVGKAGQLLTKMIQACTFDREDVYILNSVKCRPPNNRNPEPTEIENCREYFSAQLNLLRPQYIVCLGAVSSQALLETKLSVGQLRGKFHQHFDSKVVVTYHPAYLLRNPAAKKAAWDDLQMMLRDAGIL